MAKRKMPVADEPVKTETTEVTEETPKKKEVKKQIGVVTGCLLLNVREKPDIESKKIGELKALEEVTIRSTRNAEWYAITTASGLKGFSMKKFISIK